MGCMWIKSSYSNGDGGDCLEWAPISAAASGVVPVRDSKRPAGAVLRLKTASWSAFVQGVNVLARP